MTDFKKIVWLASYPKSGNTWVRLLLDAYFLGELDINEIVCSSGDDAIARYNPGDSSIVHRWPVDIQQLMRPAAMLRTVLAYNEDTYDVPLFIKTHQANMVANGIELLPQALTKATVFIVRDPRDVLPSFANHMGVEMADAAKRMCHQYQLLAASEKKAADFLSDWASHTESYLAASDHNVLLVQYENLRADPETEFARILEHAGVTPDPERVRKAVELTDLSQLQKVEQTQGFSEASAKAKDPFFNTGKVGKKIPSELKSILERNLRKTMIKMGYLGKRKSDGTVQLH